MAGRGTINRQVQVGVEVTPGTPVAANKLLPLTSLSLSRTLEHKEYRAQGFKPVTGTKIVKDFGGGTLAGPLNYTEIIYPLNTLVTGVIATPGGGTTSRTHTFTPTVTGTDTFKTLTIQEGDTTAAVQMAYSFLVDFGINITLDDCTVSGTLLGQLPSNTTLTGAPSAIAQLPAGPREIDLYMDPTFGAIGTTKVTDTQAVTIGLNNKQALKWVLNTTNTSFKDSIEVAPTLAFTFTTEHNAQSRALYAAVTASSNPIQYFQLKATGPIIEAALPYFFQFQCAAQVTATAQEDVDGVWGYQYTCVPVYDSAFGAPWKIVVQNTLTTL